MDSNPQTRVTPQLVLGLCAIGFGVLFMLDNLHIMNIDNAWRYWPVVLIVVGVIQLLWAGSRSGFAAGVVLTAAGSLLLLDSLHYLQFAIEDFWPLILVAVGGFLVWQAIEGRQTHPASGGADVTGFALLSGVVRTCNTPSFRGGDLTAIMGGCEIDLRQASIEDGEAVIQVFALWGGIEIKVPEDWNVRSSVIPLLGGFEDKTRPPRDGIMKTLFIKGFAIMGGVEIRN